MTSLSQQLKKLAVPQTTNLVDLKKRPSILFDLKEAATKDRKTIYDLGCEGLSELILLNNNFEIFRNTLFDSTSLNLERAVEDAAFNKELNCNIKKFFNHLSPYFMLRSSHLCLEWLIRRFQVHEYNKNDFVALILPYHETNIFVKCVQILRINDPFDPWNWLQPLQKPGVPLAKSAIFNKAATEPGFLQFLCKSVIDATKELGNRASTLQCLINFYCSIVIGALENCNEIKEWHVTSVLPSIIKGMKSEVTDFISASFMITTQLVNKTTLTSKLLHVLINHIFKIDCQPLQSTSVLLLNWIAKTHAKVLTKFTEATFIEFIKKPWLNEVINNLCSNGISMLYLAIPMIKTAFHILQNDITNAETSKQYMESLLFEVKFSSHSAGVIIKCCLEELLVEEHKKADLKDGDVIDLESDDDEAPSKATNLDWFTKVIHKLEVKYPNEMDMVIKEAMKTSGEKTSKNGMKIAFAYRYKFLNADTSSKFVNIYHHNPKIRALSVKEIVRQINQNSNDMAHFNVIKETLADRINDDNAKVVEEILKLPTSTCIEMIGINSFVENLINVLDKAIVNHDAWATVQGVIITHLTSKNVVNHFDSNMILLAISRYLMPIKNDKEHAKYIQIILKSPFAEKKIFLKTLAKKYTDNKINIIDFKKDFMDILSASNDAPHAEDLVESMKRDGDNMFKTPVQMTHFLIMVTLCFKTKNEVEKSLDIYDFTMRQLSHFSIKHSTKEKKISNSIPLELFTNFLKSIANGTHFENLQDWKSDSKSLILFFKIFNLLTSEAFSSKQGNIEKEEWTKCLRDVLNCLFPTTNLKLSFLSQFLINENFSGVENFTVTRIRAVKLLEVILRGGKVEPNHIDLRFILKAIVALSSPLTILRECALDILRVVKSFKDESNLIGKIIERSEEIQFDAEQIPLILFTILNPKRKTSDNELVLNILSIIDDPAENINFKSKIIGLLKHIKNVNITSSMIPLALLALENIQLVGNIKVLDEVTTSIFTSVITRLDANCMKELITTNKFAWGLIEKSFKLSKVFSNFNGQLTPVPCITLQILDETTYNQLPNAYKMKLLKLIIETLSLSENDALFLEVNKALKKCTLDCKYVLPLLESMNDTTNEDVGLHKKKKAIARTQTTDISLLNSNQWKLGIVLLEILENKKKLLNTQLLIPILFDTLKRCLDMESQPPAEYTKQLVLSALLHCCQKSKAENQLNTISESTFRIDLIVQCIRVTQNPQTHYNALLLLSHCAVLFPQQVLHNLVDIFTFMGSSIARHDDAFSFQIISNIVESIIPILVQDNNSKTKDQKRVLPVLKIFSDILLDVPEHRRKPLYTKLLSILGAEKYFWLFLCVVFESHVIKEEKNKLSSSNNQSGGSGEKLPRRIEIVLNLLNEFSSNVSIQTCTSLMDYIKRLPMSKEDEDKSTKITQLNVQDSQDNDLFNVNARSSKQLRHYKYLILQFVSTFTSSIDFLKTVAFMNEEQNKMNKSLYQSFIIKTLSYIPEVTSAIEKSTDPTQSKFWKVILHHCYDALDNVISLLSPDIFLVAVHGLMQHKLMMIRKKIIELLIAKLQQKIDYFEDCSDENVLNLLNSLSELVETITAKDHKNSLSAAAGTLNSNEITLVQQAGLIAIKLLSRHFAQKYIDQFRNIVEHLTNITKNRAQLPKVVLATVILTVVEVMSNLRAHAVPHLPKLMPHMIETLNDQSSILQKQSPDNVCLALLTGVQKLFESMPLFLAPYIMGIVSALSKIWSHVKNINLEKDQKRIAFMTKLEAILKKIAIKVPARILIPNCEKAYHALMNDENFSSINCLMQLFSESVSNASESDLLAVQMELTNFFLKCLEFRSQISNSSSKCVDVCSTEMEIVNAFVAWILKLSESSFRPVHKKVYNWGFEKDAPKERVLTFFILNRCVSDSLKSLFVLFSSDLVKDAAELLNACNTSKNSELYFENSNELNTELLKNVLCTLTNIFMYDSKSLSNPHRFETLMQPIVDQLENKLIFENEELQGILLLCIGQLAVAVSSDVLWKQLHYQILLKTRANIPEVRIISFNCCVELARKLGDDFQSLLPETVPFIAELFEDENALVVQNSRKAVQELEGILGESLQKYL